jgi:hypothetical protein
MFPALSLPIVEEILHTVAGLAVEVTTSVLWSVYNFDI